jgi:hypothetical protein
MTTIANYETELTGNRSHIFVNNTAETVTTTKKWGNGSMNSPYATIALGVEAVVPGGTVYVAAGTYNENLTINKSLTLSGPNAEINPNTDTRTPEATIIGQINLSSDDITVTGLTVTNPNVGYGIYANKISDAQIKNNIIDNIGTGLTSGSAQAIYIYTDSSPVSNITIENNQISNVGSLSLVKGSSGSAKGIFVGDTSYNGDISNLVINGNNISLIFAGTIDWPAGRGAYGILINHLSSDLHITNNTIDTLEGLWAHAIGLEGDTPNAAITGNTISKLVDHKTSHDSVGVWFEDNSDVKTVTIQKNSFASAVYWGIADSTNTKIDASQNYWGTADKSIIKTRVTNKVDFKPYYIDAEMHILSNEPSSETAFYVDKGYNDTNAGGYTYGYNAFSSIQDAIDRASTTETTAINISSGTYDESILIEKPITLSGPKNAKPIISGSTGSDYIVKINGTNEVELNNLEINGGSTNAFAYGILINDSGESSNPIEIKNSIVKNIWKGSAIAIGAENSSYFSIHDNTISSFHKSGVRFINSDGKFYGNEVIGDNVDGTERVQNLVNLWSGSDVEIYNNTLHNALTTPDVTPTWGSVAIYVHAYHSGYPDSGSSSADVHNNKIYDSDDGIVVGSYYATTDTSSAIITNNKFSNLRWAINFEKGEASATVTNNSFSDIDKAINADDESGTPITKPSVNAEENWWGTSVQSEIASKVYEGVDFEPYYTTSTKTSLSDGISTDANYSSTTTGQADLPEGVTSVELSDSTNLDVSTNMSTASDGNINVGGSDKPLNSFTNGNLTGEDFTASKNVGGKSVTVGKAVVLKSGTDDQPFTLTNSNLSNVTVTIPDATTVLAPSGWDGIITPPKKTSNSSSSNAPSGFSVGNTVIEVGSANNVLLFDRPVAIVLAGVTGNVGYKPAGSDSWIQITALCGGDYLAPNAPSFPGECYISNGTDTKIYTYHFTSFASLNTIVYSAGPGSGGGSTTVATTTTTPIVSVVTNKFDTNKDSKVDILDFNALMTNWGKNETGNVADFNGDNKVDILDFNSLMINWTK